METTNSEEWERLRRLQNERDEVERQRDRVREELKETTNKYLTALAAAEWAEELIGVRDEVEERREDEERHFGCGDLQQLAGAPGMHIQLEIPNHVDIPNHVEAAIEAVDELSKKADKSKCLSGYWRREEAAVAAIAVIPTVEEEIVGEEVVEKEVVEEEVVFRVSDQESPERLHEEAETKRQQLCAEVEDNYQKFEQLKLEYNRRDDLIRDLLRKAGRDNPEAESTERYPSVPEPVLTETPKAPYLCAYHLGQLLEEENWPKDWRPTTLNEVEDKFKERYDHHTGVTSLRTALRNNLASYDDAPFLQTLGGMTDAERRDAVFTMCDRCHSYYRDHAER